MERRYDLIARAALLALCLAVSALVTGLVGKLHEWGVPITPFSIESGWPLIVAFVLSLCLDDRRDKNDIRATLLYSGIANFAGFMLGAHYGLTPQILFLSPLMTGLVVSYAVVGVLDRLGIFSTESEDVYLHPERSTAAGSWVLWGTALFAANLVGISYFGVNSLGQIILTIVAIIACVVVEIVRSFDINPIYPSTCDQTPRSTTWYGGGTIFSLILLLVVPRLGYHFDLLSSLIAIYALVTITEIIFELRSGEIIGGPVNNTPASRPSRTVPVAA